MTRTNLRIACMAGIVVSASLTLYGMLDFIDALNAYSDPNDGKIWARKPFQFAELGLLIPHGLLIGVLAIFKKSRSGSIFATILAVGCLAANFLEIGVDDLQHGDESFVVAAIARWILIMAGLLFVVFSKYDDDK